MSIPTKEVSIHVDTPVNNGVKKTKTPRNYDSILKGALALELPERVKLKKALFDSIQDEVERAKKHAEIAIKLAEL